MPTVLLVEDQFPILEHLRHALECAGYTVLGATSGDSAIRVCQTYHGTIDVLVSDVLMFPITGFQVAATIKSAHPNVIVILMSGSPRYTFSNPVSSDDFLQKPFAHDDLLAAIARHTPTPAQTGGPRESWN